MQKNPDQKRKKTLIILVMITIVLLLILVVFIDNNGLNTADGVGISVALFFMIIIGIVKISKLLTAIKSDRESQNISPTPIPPIISDNSNNSVADHTDVAAPTVLQDEHIEGKMLPKWIQNIVSWLQKFTKPKRIIIVISFFIVVIIVVVILYLPSIGEPDTTITGTWEHELGSYPYAERSYVMVFTSWSVDTLYDTGFIYMNVNDDGTFTITYNDVVVNYGTWEETDDGYMFLHRDPIGTLASTYQSYTIKGTKLYLGSATNVQSFYTKK